MIRAALVFAFIILGIQAGYVFGVPVVKNSMLEGRMKELARNPTNKPVESLRGDVVEYLEDNEIVIQPDQLVMRDTGDKITIAAHYKVEATTWYYSHTYEFLPASEEAARIRLKPRPQTIARRSR
jgi:hypothetical protein